MKNDDEDDEIINKIINKYKAIEEQSDFVLVEGTNFTGEGAIIEFDINIVIAKNLGIPAIILASGVDKTMEGLVGNLQIAYDSFDDKGVQVLAAIANKVQPENMADIMEELKKQLPETILVAAIPSNPILANPSVKEINGSLEG